MCLHVLTKTLPFKFIGVALRLLNSQWKMHHCDVLCLVLSSLCSLPAYHFMLNTLGVWRCPLFVHLAYQCCCCYSSFLFVCFVGDLYAGHPYIQLISFEIFLLSYLCTFYNNTCNYFHYYPTHSLDTSPAHTCKEALPVASNSWLVILHTATELSD